MFGINELLAGLFGFTDESNRFLLLADDRRISRQSRARVGQHRCGDETKSAEGLLAPFLDWAWGAL